MKKILLTLAALLMLTGSAAAAVKTFESLSVDVPAGWTDQAQGPAVILMAPDQQTMIMLVCVPANGQSAKDVATKTASTVQGSAPVAEGNGYTFTFKQQGQEGMMYIAEAKGSLIMATLGGKNADFLKIAKTVAPK